MTEKALPQAEAITSVYNAAAYCDITSGNIMYDKQHTFFYKIRTVLLKKILENHEVLEHNDGSITIDGWRIIE